MGNKLYVGNLPYSVRDEDLQQSFGQFGAVTSAKVMMERDTGRSKGFGFVEMGNDAEAQAAINGMNGQSSRRPQHHCERSPSDGGTSST
jgi:cold-inducible RNA-binding protein